MRTTKTGVSKNSWTDRDVADHWDKVSHIYSNENNKVKKAHNQRFTETLKYINLTPNSKILNISSRDCELVDYILKKDGSAEIINAEISAGLIREATKIRPYAFQIKLETYSQLPFPDGQFDRVISLETLEHVAEPIRFLKELYRVSKPGTRLILSCPPLTSEPAYRIYTFFFGGHGEGPHRFLRSKEVKYLISKTGWNLIYHQGTVLIPIGPAFIQNIGEWVLKTFHKTFVSELGIRQFYVCEKD
jgi:ubiquinone/menaquinone biosynthesis C-methylase UbiE